MKTAISIPDDLFITVKEMSKKLNISRSQFFVEAVKDYITRQKNKEIFEALNKVYSEIDTKQEVELRKQSKKYYSKRLEAEKW
jgi:metal-responsive CopG/Arc/MetJ family transcriptional regulator